MKKHSTHQSKVIYLDKAEWKSLEDEFGSESVPNTTPETIAKNLKDFLVKELDKPKNCKNCGGVLPELTFIYQGKTYEFTCFRIHSKEAILAETDYDKFGLHRAGRMFLKLKESRKNDQS